MFTARKCPVKRIQWSGSRRRTGCAVCLNLYSTQKGLQEAERDMQDINRLRTLSLCNLLSACLSIVNRDFFTMTVRSGLQCLSLGKKE